MDIKEFNTLEKSESEYSYVDELETSHLEDEEVGYVAR